MSHRAFSLVGVVLLSLAPDVARAELPRKLEAKVSATARAMDGFMAARDAEIPRELLTDAACVVVIPDLTKGALGVGGRYGKGLASCRDVHGAWGPPAFVEIGGASIGFQFGAEQMDLLLIVRGRDSAKWLLRDKLTLGADASVAAGPYGRTAAAGTDVALRAGILSYSRSRGLFLGAALDGAVLKQDRTDNKKLYGRDVTAKEILLPSSPSKALPVPESVRDFMSALERHAPRRAEE